MKANSDFEESFEKLKNISDKIKKQDISLEDAIGCYEEGMEYYKVCNKILQDAKQKIEFYEGEE